MRPPEGRAAGVGGVLDRHVPAVEVHHAGAQLAVRGVESGLADDGRFGVGQGRDLESGESYGRMGTLNLTRGDAQGGNAGSGANAWLLISI